MDLIKKINDLKSDMESENTRVGVSSKVNVMINELDSDLNNIFHKYNAQFIDYKASTKPKPKGWGENYERTMDVVRQMNVRVPNKNI